MVGEAGIISGVPFAKAFASIATQSQRPNFELQFNNLQNALIDRLNKKIDEANEDLELENNIDVFLRNKEKELVRFHNSLQDFTFDNSRNINAVGELASQLDNLSTALDAGDTETFDQILAKINQIVGNTKVTNGYTVGIYISDGIHEIRRDGLLQFDNGGTAEKASKYSDFANDSEINVSITSALAKLSTSAEILLLKGEAVEGLRKRTSTNLNSTILQIQAAQTANKAAKAEEIAKLRDEYSQLLNVISLAFETSNTLANELSSTLFSPNKVPPGSTVNLFL